MAKVFKWVVCLYHAEHSVFKWLDAVEFFSANDERLEVYYDEQLDEICGFCVNATKLAASVPKTFLRCARCILMARGLCGPEELDTVWSKFSACCKADDQKEALKLSKQMLEGILQACMDQDIPQKTIDRWVETRY